MIELIRSWLVGLSCCAILIAVVKGVMPDGAAKKASGLVCGVILLIAAVKPLATLELESLSAYTVEYSNAVARYSANVVEVNERLAKVIIEEQSAAYILDKAASLGVELKAEVTTRRGGGDYWYPYSVTLCGDCSGEQRQTIGVVIEAELAIPAERQTWTD